MSLIGERIEVGLKRGKFDHPAWTNEKTGANEEGENEGETHAATAVPTWKIPHQLNNIITQPISALLITHHPVNHKSHPQISHMAYLLTTLPIPKHHL